jgi:hypothetical protein
MIEYIYIKLIVSPFPTPSSIQIFGHFFRSRNIFEIAIFFLSYFFLMNKQIYLDA